MSCSWFAVLNPCVVCRALWECALYVCRRIAGCCTGSTVAGQRISPTLTRLAAASRALRRLLTPQGSASSAEETNERPPNEAAETRYQNAVTISGVSNMAYVSDSDESQQNIDSSPEISRRSDFVPLKTDEKDSNSIERSYQTDSSGMLTASQGSSSDVFHSLELNVDPCEEASVYPTQASARGASNPVSDSTEKDYGTFKATD